MDPLRGDSPLNKSRRSLCSKQQTVALGFPSLEPAYIFLIGGPIHKVYPTIGRWRTFDILEYHFHSIYPAIYTPSECIACPPTLGTGASLPHQRTVLCGFANFFTRSCCESLGRWLKWRASRPGTRNFEPLDRCSCLGSEVSKIEKNKILWLSYPIFSK